MTIANTISSALSGLSARGREAGVVSSNIANATSEGYARRVLETTSGPYGTVRVEGVRRVEDTHLSGELRAAESSRAGADVAADSLRRLERAFGSPDDEGSLTGKLARLEAVLTDAASDPGSEARLEAVGTALVEFTDGVQAASDAIRDARTMAEAGVEKDVAALQEGLKRVALLNGEIARARATNRDATELEDKRRSAIDELAHSVPVKAYERKDGMVSLVGEGGVQLLEGLRPAEIEFTAARFVTADMAKGSGLEPVRVRGREMDPATPGGRLSGGSLGAHMALRDDTLTDLQARLDAVTEEVATRLNGVHPGLLVDRDGGVAIAAANKGVSGRIQVDATVLDDPWRFRDGIAAAAPGPAGDSTKLRGMADVLAALEPAPAGFLPSSRNVSELLGDVVSGLAGSRLSAESDGARHSSAAEVLRQMQRVDGVDTDAELQRLMEIERGYAAGARVLQAVDEMLERIMRL